MVDLWAVYKLTPSTDLMATNDLHSFVLLTLQPIIQKWFSYFNIILHRAEVALVMIQFFLLLMVRGFCFGDKIEYMGKRGSKIKWSADDLRRAYADYFPSLPKMCVAVGITNTSKNRRRLKMALIELGLIESQLSEAKEQPRTQKP